MIWFAIGAVWAGCMVLAVILFTRAARTCVCKCQHMRCKSDITGIDMLCDYCREIRKVTTSHCHARARVIDGKSASAIIVPSPQRPR